jgi:hypothetical protein
LNDPNSLYAQAKIAKDVPECELLNYLVAQKSAGILTGALVPCG